VSNRSICSVCPIMCVSENRKPAYHARRLKSNVRLRLPTDAIGAFCPYTSVDRKSFSCMPKLAAKKNKLIHLQMSASKQDMQNAASRGPQKKDPRTIVVCSNCLKSSRVINNLPLIYHFLSLLQGCV
jgi:hypothetical protein